MGEFIFGTIWLFLLSFLFWNGTSCQREMWQEQVIKDNGFCLHSEVSGQKFEKCYEVKER